MTRVVSPKLTAYAALASIAFVAAIAFEQPGIAAIGAPFAVAIVAGLVAGRRSPPVVTASIVADGTDVLEGARVTLHVELGGGTARGRCDVGLRLPPGLVLVEGSNVAPLLLRPESGPAAVDLVVEARRWGAYRLGPVAVRVREPGGLATWEGEVGTPTTVRVRPARPRLRGVAHPFDAGAAAGEHTSRTRGEGIEFAELRHYVPGDRAGAINWRASARRGALLVNQRHPERNTDIVLFIDTFAEPGLADTVRIASTLADAYLRRHDRVGLVSFGGVMSWLEPGGGPRQRERLDKALLGAESYTSFAWKTIRAVPARMLPPRGLVIGISPLVDERARAALAAMALRRLDLAIVEVPLAPPAGWGATWSEELAGRIEAMQQQAVRDRFLAMGVAVVQWDEAAGVETAVREITEYRRHARVRVRP